MKNTFNNFRQTLTLLTPIFDYWRTKKHVNYKYRYNGKVYDMYYPNRAYSHINRRFKELGIKEQSFHIHIDLNGKVLNDNERFNFGSIYICANFSTLFSPIRINIKWKNGEKDYKFFIHSNKEITKNNLISEVLKWVYKNTVVHEGAYRDLQLILLYDKEAFKQHIKYQIEYRQTDRYRWDKSFEIEQDARIWIMNKFGYYNDNMDIYKLANNAIRLSKIKPKPTKPTPIYEFNMNALFDLDGDIDELENEFWNELETQSEGCELII